MAQPAFIYPHMHSTGFTPFWATQVESRLPTARTQRSLLQAPKSIPSKLKTSNIKSPHVSPTSPRSGIPQKTSVLDNKHLLIGHRVWTADGRAGTLQFKGKTHFSQGCLCGIRLDEPTGKNDGSVDGIQYFKCRPNHGIFIHAYKVQAVNSAGEVKPLDLAPHTGEKVLSPSKQHHSGKEIKPSSKIPAIGVGGKITRPKSLLVNDEHTPSRPPVGRLSLTKRVEVTRADCFSVEKVSNSSKLFQKKRISPADSGITVPGWTHDRTLPTSRLPSIHSKSPSVGFHDATFTLSRGPTSPLPNQATPSSDQSPPSRKKTPELFSPRIRKSSCGNVKKGLSSRPSLSDLTQLLEENSRAESVQSKVKTGSSRPKTNLNETFEIDSLPHRISPLLSERRYQKDSAGSPARDLNLTFDIGKKVSPLSWEPGDKAQSTPVSATDNQSYFWESEGVPETDVSGTYKVPDSEEDIEYNEFWAVPSTLDTPTGRLRFDLLTPEEFEQALNDCNIPLESPPSNLLPSPEETQPEPQLSYHCKPKVLDALTVVEDDLLVGSDSTFDNIPSFLVPAWSMESEAANVTTGIRRDKESEECFQLELSLDGTSEASGKLEIQNDFANNNTVDFDLSNANQSKSSTDGQNRTVNLTTVIMSDDAARAGVSNEETSKLEVDPHVDTTADDALVFTDDLSNEWKNLVQQAEADIDVGPQRTSVSEAMNGEVVPNGIKSRLDGPEFDLTHPSIPAQTAELQDATFVVSGTGEGHETNADTSADNGEISENRKCAGVKAVSPTVTLNILNETFETNGPEKEKSFASEGSSESASTVIVEGLAGNEHEQKCQTGIKERCPSAELETVTQCEMAEMTSPSYTKQFASEAFDSSSSQTSGKLTQDEPQREKGDNSKLPRKRMSYLQQPKSFTSSRESELPTKSHVATAKLKLTSTKSADSRTETSVQESRFKKASSQASKKTNNKNPTAATNKIQVTSNTSVTIPKQKTETGTRETKATSKLIGVKSKIDTGRKSLDLTGNKPSLATRRSTGQNSTSSLEVEPNSLSSSNRSMRSDLSAASSKTNGRNNSVGGKPANKTTSSLRQTERGHSERKTSTSTVNSEASLKTESRTSLSSRLSTSTSDAKLKRPRTTPRKEPSPQIATKLQAFSFSKPSKPAPLSLPKSKSIPSKSTEVSQLSNSLGNGVTSVDAAPVRRGCPPTRLPRTSLLASKKTEHAASQETSRRPSVGKEADGTKANRGLSSPSLTPTLHLEQLTQAKANVKHLEALCESRTKELIVMRLNLRSGVQGFDAMAVLVQYLTHKLDAFSNPHLKTRIRELEQHLQDAESLTAQKEDELGSIQQKLADTRRNNQEQAAQMQKDYQEQLKDQEERLHNKHLADLESIHDEHQRDINSMEEDHLAQVSELKDCHHQSFQEMEEHHIEEVTQIQHQHQEHIEELSRETEKEKKWLIDDAQLKQQELQDEVYKRAFQCENLKERVARLEEMLQKDSDAKVQAALFEKRNLQADIESMKSVEELRNKELKELRTENMAIKKELEKLPVKDDEIQRLKAKVEDLEALMANQQDYQQQLSSDHITLRENYEREVNEKKRLSMEKEQLSWRLSLHSEASSPVSLSPGGTFFPCTSPSRSPTRSPSRSPSALKQNLSRSSSMDSPESGVFSPQNS